MLYVIMFIIGFIVVYLISKNKEESKTLKEEPFGKKFKVLVDTLGKNLWDGQQFILMKKSDRQYFIQKSRTPHNESYVYIIYRPNTIHLDYYENLVGAVTTYKKTYSTTGITEEGQRKMAMNFVNQVFLNGNMKF